MLGIVPIMPHSQSEDGRVEHQEQSGLYMVFQASLSFTVRSPFTQKTRREEKRGEERRGKKRGKEGRGGERKGERGEAAISVSRGVLNSPRRLSGKEN